MILRVIPGQLTGDDVRRGARLRERDTGLESRKDLEGRVAPCAQHSLAAGAELAEHRRRDKTVHGDGPLGAEKFLRSDTDDRERMTVDVNRPADHGWIAAESSLPATMRENDDGICAGRFAFPRLKQSAKRRLNAEQGKVIGAGGLNPGAFRLLVRRAQMNRVHKGGDHILEVADPLAVVLKVEPRMPVGHFPDSAFLKHHHEPVRVLDRQWLKEEGVDDGEDRRVYADAERECEDSYGRKARILQQHPQAETHVLQRCLAETCAKNFTAFFANALQVAETTTCRTCCFFGRHSRR